MNNFKEKADKIWEVANLLRGDYKRSDYGKVILPITVLRRLDCVLKNTKADVLAAVPKLGTSIDRAKDKVLNKVAGYNFHNRSKFDFDKIVADPNNVAANLRNYINGFSSTAREIIEYFNFDDQIDYESIPFLRKEKDGSLHPQTIEEYYNREVKPHLPESWIDHKKTKVGYEINFTKYFYEFKPLRSLEDIKADIKKLEMTTSDQRLTVLD